MADLKFTREYLQKQTIVELKRLCNRYSIKFDKFKSKHLKQEYIDALMNKQQQDLGGALDGTQFTNELFKEVTIAELKILCDKNSIPWKKFEFPRKKKEYIDAIMNAQETNKNPKESKSSSDSPPPIQNEGNVASCVSCDESFVYYGPEIVGVYICVQCYDENRNCDEISAVQKEVDDFKIGDNKENIIFEHSRCHEPEIALVEEYSVSMHDQLSKAEQMNRNKLLFEMYDLWKPKNVNSNCGQVYKKQNSWHWKFRFDLHAFEELFDELIDNEENEENKQILEKQREDFLNKQEEWRKVKDRDQLQQIKNDYKLYQEFTKYTDNSLPTKEEFFGNQYVRAPIKMDAAIKFGHLPHSTPFKSSCTRLYIEIPTNVERSKFKMTDYESELNKALETITDLVTNSADITTKYVASKMKGADTTKYSQPLSWFELGITTNYALKRKMKDSDPVTIMVYAELSIIHYIFFLMHKFEHKPIQKWIKQYIKNLNNKLSKNENKRAVCKHNDHYLIQLELKEKKMKSFKCIGKGGKNHIIRCIKEYNEENDIDEVTESINSLNLLNRGNRRRGRGGPGRGGGGHRNNNNNNNNKRYSGTCKAYKVDRGYGFIAMDDGSEDVYFDFRDIETPDIDREALRGQRMTFEINTRPDGRRRAFRIRIEKGGNGFAGGRGGYNNKRGRGRGILDRNRNRK